MTEKYYYEKEWSKHMWKAENWKDYEVLDTGNGEKLERWGDYLLVRPDPQVIWNSCLLYTSLLQSLYYFLQSLQ